MKEILRTGFPRGQADNSLGHGRVQQESETMQQEAEPIVLAVAPNGARRGRNDHPALPLTTDEIAATARACAEAGAAMLHLHVRDAAGRHLLDLDAYAAACRAVRQAAGQALLLQLTTEAAGRYGPAEQAALLRGMRRALGPVLGDGPLFASLGLREVDGALRDGGLDEAALARLFADAAADGIRLQVILYDRADLQRYLQLRARGLVADPRPALLFVLGRYAADGQSRPDALLPFLTETIAPAAALPPGWSWMVCAFGARESACALAAAALGGHARLGFENNLLLSDGRTAPDNAALVAQLAAALPLAGRRPADAAEAARILGLAD